MIEMFSRFIMMTPLRDKGERSMDKIYYQTIDAMEKKHINPEYINGWACGFLHNPKREEQRLNDAYDAGYSDGWDRKVDGFSGWVMK